jgi:hypothetical protein
MTSPPQDQGEAPTVQRGLGQAVRMPGGARRCKPQLYCLTISYVSYIHVSRVGYRRTGTLPGTHGTSKGRIGRTRMTDVLEYRTHVGGGWFCTRTGTCAVRAV